jgi:hypothetical protein
MAVLGQRVSSMLDQELREFQMAPFGRAMQRSPPTVVLGRRISSVLDQEPREFQMAP